MIYHLTRVEIWDCGRSFVLGTHCCVEASHIIPDAITFWLVLLGTQALISNSIWYWLPLEIKHGVDWLYFDPPASPLQGSSYQAWVVSRCYYEFIAIFHICVFKRDFTFLFFFPVKICPSFWCLYVFLLNFEWWMLSIHHLNKLWLGLIRDLRLLSNHSTSLINMWENNLQIVTV